MTIWAQQLTSDVLTLGGVYHSHSALGRPFAQPDAIARTTEDQSTPLTAARPIHVAQLWQDVMDAFGANALPMCILSLAWVAGAAVLAAVKHLRPQAFDVALLIVGAVGLVVSAFTRGAITWMVLHTRADGRSASFSTACRASLTRLPALLFGTLGYSAAIILSAVGLNVWLRPAQLDSAMLVIPPRPPTTAEHIGRAVTASSIDALLPDPWTPLPDVLPRLRSHAYAATVDADLLRRLRSNALKHTVSGVVNRAYATSTPEFWLVGLGGLMIVLVGEALLRLYPVMAMAQSGAPRLWTPLVESARLAFKNWWAVALHIWLTRLVIATLSAAFVIAPAILMQSTITPKLAQMAFALWLPSICSVCTTLLAAGLSRSSRQLSSFTTRGWRCGLIRQSLTPAVQ